MKVLFVMLHPGYVRNYESSIRLLADRGHSVRVVYERFRNKLGEKVQIERLADDFPGLISFGELPERRPTAWGNLATVVRTLLDYSRYLDPAYDAAAGLRGRIEAAVPRAPVLLLRGVAACGTRPLRGLQRLCAAIDRAVPADREVEAFVAAEDPDVVLVTPLVDFASEQVDYVKAAARQGRPCGLCVASWDNLTNKGLIRVVPDRVFVWNEAQKDEAVRMHGVDPDAVVVTGAQLFDQWFDRRPSRDREAFCRRVGLDPRRPFLVYLGSSFFIAPDESPVVERWIRALRASADDALAGAGVLIRPHPTNVQQWLAFDLSSLGNVAIWPPLGAEPFSAEFRDDFFDSLYHGAVVVGVNTSAMIEAAIVGRPVCTIEAEEFAHSQAGTLHYQHLVATAGGFVHPAPSIDDSLRLIAGLLRGEGGGAAENRRFVESFVRPHGLSVAATPRLVEGIEALAALAAGARRGAPAAAGPARLALAPLAALFRVAWSPRFRTRAPKRADQRVLRPIVRTGLWLYAWPATAGYAGFDWVGGHLAAAGRVWRQAGRTVDPVSRIRRARDGAARQAAKTRKRARRLVERVRKQARRLVRSPARGVARGVALLAAVRRRLPGRSR